MVKKKNELFAVISIGSHHIKLLIAEAGDEKNFTVIEKTKYPISLARESFSEGSISVPTVLEICSVLNKLRNLLKDYGVRYYDVIATSAIREARNKLFIVDKIMLSTGMQVRILTNAEERYLTFKSIRKNYFLLEDFSSMSSLFLDLGSGSISVSIYSKNKLTFSQNLNMGALRLYEATSELEKENANYPSLLEEFTSSNIDRIINFGPHKKIMRFFIFGSNARFVSKICRAEKLYPKMASIAKDNFLEAFEAVRFMTKAETQKNFSLSDEEVHLFLPALVIVKGFLDLTVSEELYIPEISLREGLLYNMMEEHFNPEARKTDDDDILSSARHIAKRFKYDRIHSLQVEKFALQIFDAIKTQHFMGNRERLLLQLACILHDTGKFLSYENHYAYSADLIMALDLVGVSENDLRIVAGCARYHSHITPKSNSRFFKNFSEKDQIISAKLIAIIRLADSLDRSHKCKFSKIEVASGKNTLKITGYAAEDTTLEQWIFKKKALYFAEVFGVCPELQIKGLLNYE